MSKQVELLEKKIKAQKDLKKSDKLANINIDQNKEAKK